MHTVSTSRARRVRAVDVRFRHGIDDGHAGRRLLERGRRNDCGHGGRRRLEGGAAGPAARRCERDACEDGDEPEPEAKAEAETQAERARRGT